MMVVQGWVHAMDGITDLESRLSSFSKFLKFSLLVINETDSFVTDAFVRLLIFT